MKFSITKRGVATPIVALVAVAAFAGIASAAPPNSFHDFGTGDVTMTATGAKLVNDTGEYSGIYVTSKSLKGMALADVHVSFTSTGEVAGGAPRFSIPLNTGAYAFLDVNNCGAPRVVSSDDATCRVFINTGGSFANWAAMAAAEPTWRVSKSATPFIIADVAGNYEVSNVDLR